MISKFYNRLSSAVVELEGGLHSPFPKSRPSSYFCVFNAQPTYRHNLQTAWKFPSTYSRIAEKSLPLHLAVFARSFLFISLACAPTAPDTSLIMDGVTGAFGYSNSLAAVNDVDPEDEVHSVSL